MTDQDITIEIAKLDGKSSEVFFDLRTEQFMRKNFDNSLAVISLPSYLTSRDAIIPVIEKQFKLNISFAIEFSKCLWNIVGIHPETDSVDLTDVYNFREQIEMALWLFSTPKQLCIALLKATNKWKE